MAESEKPKTAGADEPETANPGRSGENAAVARCIRAWHRAQRKESAAGGSDYKSSCAGNIAYLRAIPSLAGYENIRDFIACVTFAAITEVIRHKDANHLLAAAKIALAALRQEPAPVETSGK
ncbi:MAG: hypothetical protein ABSH08_19810 [Tepidisphaeraceae bacterium]|jgi:hypothetical protein